MSAQQCVAYARISRDIEGKGLGVGRQLEDCRKKAESLGWTITDEYVDNDLSASKDVVRPQYDRLIKGIEDGSVKALVVYDLDRLTRKPSELEAFITLSDKHGVALANVSGDVDLTNANGRMIARIKGAVARQEAERIGERTSRAARQRAEKGIPQKGRHRLFGYTRDWEVNEDEAPIVKEAFKRRAAGESTTSIANDLNRRGIKTVAGNQWRSRTLAVTLTKPIYAGLREYKGEIIGPSAVPALIDEATFNAATSNIAKDSRGTNARAHLLSGILICAKCLTGMKGNTHTTNYRCSTTYHGCGRVSVRIKDADRWALYVAMEKHLSEPAPDTSTNIRDYKGEVAAIDAKIARLQDGYEQGIYTLSELAPRLKELRTTKTKVLREEAKDATPRMSRPIKSYMDFHAMSVSAKRVWLTQYIENIVCSPADQPGSHTFDPRRLTFHMTDGSQVTPDPSIDPEDV